MSILYILQNQQGYYLKKMGTDKTIEWIDGREPAQLFRTAHKDEAVNMMCETNSLDVELRIAIKEYPAHAKNYPVIPKDELPEPLEKTDTISSDTEELLLAEQEPSDRYTIATSV